MKQRIVMFLLGTAWLAMGVVSQAQSVAGQESSSRSVTVISAQDLDLLRKDLRTKRKELTAANLRLTDAEGERFWPVYEQYVKELIAINDKKYALIQQYAAESGRLTNDGALVFVRQWLDFDIALNQLRQKYVPMVAKVLDGKKTATFFQLDRRIAMMQELQVASQIPLADSQ